jgi:putative flippase GtrA
MRAAAVYVLIQVLAYGLDMGTFVLLHRLYEASVISSNIAAKIVAGCFAFVSHRHITFAIARPGPLISQVIRYSLLLLANSFASSALLAFFMSFVSFPVAAKIFADTILIAVSFSLSKSVVFRGAKASDGH